MTRKGHDQRNGTRLLLTILLGIVLVVLAILFVRGVLGPLDPQPGALLSEVRSTLR